MNTFENFFKLPADYIEKITLSKLDYENNNDAFKGLKNKFCIACTARSGSSYLSIGLDRYGLSFYEYFNLNGFIKNAYENSDITTTSKLMSYLVDKHAPNSIFSVKLAYENIGLLALFGELQNFSKEWKTVFLTRENILRQAISSYIAILTNQWTNVMPKKYDAKEIDYDFQKILNLVDAITIQNAKWERFFKLLNITPYRVVYEDLIKDPNVELESIAHFFGIDIKQYPDARNHQPWIKSQTTFLNHLFEKRFMEDALIMLDSNLDNLITKVSN